MLPAQPLNLSIQRILFAFSFFQALTGNYDWELRIFPMISLTRKGSGT